MSIPTEHFYQNIDAETLNRLLTTKMLVSLAPGEDDYEDKSGIYSAGVASRRDDPEQSSLGLRLVPGNASGDERHTDHRPAANLSPADMLDRAEGSMHTGIYVPIELVVAALDADDMDEFLTPRHKREDPRETEAEADA